VHSLVRLNHLGEANALISQLPKEERELGEIRSGEAALLIAQGAPGDAIDVLAPVLDGSIAVLKPVVHSADLASRYRARSTWQPSGCR
jgi:hypothetical protein